MNKKKYLFPDLKLPPLNQQCEIDLDNNKFWVTLREAITKLFSDKILLEIDDILKYNHPV